MLADRPIFLRSSRTPSIAGLGIALAGPEGPCDPDGNATWLDGALAVSAVEGRPEAREDWLCALFVTAVVRDGDGVLVANLVKDRRPYVDQAVAATLPDGSAAIAFPFAFDLGPTLGVPPEARRYHVRVSARHYRSSAILVEVAGGGAGAALDGPFPETAPPQNAVDWLIQAYALARAELHGAAVEAFEKALAEREVRKDIDGGHLYNAACEACKAVYQVVGQRAEERVKQALPWLKEDLRRRRELLGRETLAHFDAEVRRAATPEMAARVERLRAETLAHYGRAREADPDLKLLHEMPGFAALFERGSSD